MTQSTIYNFDEFGCFTLASTAFKDPRATIAQGVDVYLLPANATFIAPPVTPLEQQTSYQFNGTVWAVVPDYRGAIAYEQAEPYSAVMVSAPGEIPVGWALTPPVLPSEEPPVEG